MPDEEVINNGKTRKREERGKRNPYHWRSCSYVNPTPLAHADTSRDMLPRGGTSQTLYWPMNFTKMFTFANPEDVP
ncbi:hypothetical protein TNCV_5043391 [Trichonephila clavipes]|nr:hypothetical protein TNCV_5043391 [Trichonephila clavipes]